MGYNDDESKVFHKNLHELIDKINKGEVKLGE